MGFLLHVHHLSPYLLIVCVSIYLIVMKINPLDSIPMDCRGFKMSNCGKSPLLGWAPYNPKENIVNNWVFTSLSLVEIPLELVKSVCSKRD